MYSQTWKLAMIFTIIGVVAIGSILVRSGRDRAQETLRADTHAGHVHPLTAAPHGSFFSDLLKTYTPRRVCMYYETPVIWLHVVGDGLTALAYYSIPFGLIYFLRHRRDLAFSWMFWLFAAFILACGTTHLIGVLDIWRPYYKVDGLVKLVTGILSLGTAIAMWPLIPHAIALPSPAQLAATVEHARERIQAEVLRDSERKYRIVADHTHAWEFWLAPDGRFLYSSPSCQRVTGYEAEAFLSDPKLLDRIIHPDDRALYVEHRGSGQEGCATEEAEFRIVRHDGAVRWIAHACVPVYDADGRFLGIRGSNRDITERKENEAALAAARQSAERAKAEAEKANQAKDHFLAVLSHELRTPLAPVLATVSMLQEQRCDADTRESLAVIRRNVELEARLIDDLLDVTRIARGKVELDRRAVAICTILEGAAEVCMPDIEARRLHFGLQIKNRPHFVHADARRMQQVFWNLIKNAIKFTPHGGCVGVRCWREDHTIVTEVVDSGVGITRETLPNIFQPFEQGGVQTTRQFGGLGLGLTISKALVEMHGGTVEAFSDGKNKGAMFRVRLPVALETGKPPAKKPAQPTASERAARALHILLVEDHGDTARIMKRLLEAEGHEVLTAGDVATALELAESEDLDLVISDLGLPDGSGHDLMRAPRQRHRGLPGIALSGYGQEEDIRRSHEAGVAEHLTKPTSPDRLAEAIAAVTCHGSSR